MITSNLEGESRQDSFCLSLMRQHWQEMRLNFKKAGLWSRETWTDGKGEVHKQREALEHELLVAGICSILAKKMNLPEDQRKLLETAALLHDIDKGPKTRAKAREVLLVAGYDTRVLDIIGVTHPEAMTKYAQGDFQGEENLLPRILFFADEIAGRDGKGKPFVMSYEDRIAAWPDESLHTESREEYNWKTQAEIELEFARAIETEFKARIAAVDEDYDSSRSLVKDIKAWLMEEKMIGEHLEQSIYKEQIEVCDQIADELISSVAQIFDRGELDFKKKHRIDFVDVEELGFEQKIIEAIQDCFPNYSIVGEETGQEKKKSDWTVYIDPICGSTNFSCRIFPFCTNIAFVKDGETKAAFVINYASKQRIVAVADKEGIFVNRFSYQRPEQLGQPIGRLHLDWGHGLESIKEERPEAIRLAKFCLQNAELDEPWEIDNFSSSISLVYVALGKLDAFIGGPHEVYDLIAGAFLIGKAGGMVLNWQGEPWRINDRQIIAARDEKTARKILELL